MIRHSDYFLVSRKLVGCFFWNYLLLSQLLGNLFQVTKYLHFFVFLVLISISIFVFFPARTESGWTRLAFISCNVSLGLSIISLISFWPDARYLLCIFFCLVHFFVRTSSILSRIYFSVLHATWSGGYLFGSTFVRFLSAFLLKLLVDLFPFPPQQYLKHLQKVATTTFLSEDFGDKTLTACQRDLHHPYLCCTQK